MPVVCCYYLSTGDEFNALQCRELLLATLVLVGTRMADVTKVVASPTARTAYQRCTALPKSTLPLRPPTALRNSWYRDMASLVPHTWYLLVPALLPRPQASNLPPAPDAEIHNKQASAFAARLLRLRLFQKLLTILSPLALLLAVVSVSAPPSFRGQTHTHR